MLLIFLINLLIICSIFYYWTLRNKYKNFPPGPWGYPIIGSLYSLGAEPFKNYGNVSKKYGKIFSISLGMLPVVVISDTELIKKAFKSDFMTGRPKSIFPMEVVSNGITFNEGREWMEQRRFALRVLKSLGMGKTSLEMTIQDELQVLIQYFKSKGNEPIELKHIFEISVMNTVWSIIASEKHSLSDERAIYMHKVCYEGFIELEVAGVAWFMPWLAKLAPNKTGVTNLLRAVRTMRGIFGELFDKRDESHSPDSLHDFIDYYIEEVKQTTDPNSSFYKENGKKNFCDTLITLFTAGSDTTSTILAWAFLYLLKNPKCLKKVQEEIDLVIGSNSLPTLTDKAKMPITEATMLEIQRLASIVPNALLHSATQDIIFEGYRIPKDTIVMADLYKIHHDEEIWGNDAYEFKPERFLNSSCTIVKNNENLIPFSTGKRICPAESLANANFFIFLTGLLQNFEFELDRSNGEPSLGIKPGLVLSTLPYKVILKPRNSMK